jgi:hypothetical protein
MAVTVSMTTNEALLLLRMCAKRPRYRTIKNAGNVTVSTIDVEPVSISFYYV